MPSIINSPTLMTVHAVNAGIILVMRWHIFGHIFGNHIEIGLSQLESEQQKKRDEKKISKTTSKCEKSTEIIDIAVHVNLTV